MPCSGWLLAFATIAAATHIQILNYANDILQAGASQSREAKIRDIFHAVLDGWWQLAVLSLAWLFIVGGRIVAQGALSFQTVSVTLKFAFVCAAALLLSAGNTGENGDVPAYAVAALILIEFHLTQEPRRRDLPALAAILAALPASSVMARDLGSVADTAAWRRYRIETAPLAQRFDAERYTISLFPKRPSTQPCFGGPISSRPGSMKASLCLRKHVTEQSRIFVLATGHLFSSPSACRTRVEGRSGGTATSITALHTILLPRWSSKRQPGDDPAPQTG